MDLVHLRGLIENVEFIKPVQSVPVTDTQIATLFADELSAYSYTEVNGKLELNKIQRFDFDGPCIDETIKLSMIHMFCLCPHRDISPDVCSFLVYLQTFDFVF